MLNALVPIVAMFIPIVAIIGGITAGIVRTLGQQKIAELAMRERIAAIERGVDPARLPPLPTVADPGEGPPRTARERSLARAQGLQIAAVITGAAGLGLCILFAIIPHTRDHNIWALGVLPILIGAALGVSSVLVRGNAPPERAPNPPPAS
jgi:hypothetical protein